MRRVSLLAAAVAATALITTAAGAHSRYPKECWRDDDCKPLPRGEPARTQRGLSWKGLAHFNDTMTRPSPDIRLHICVPVRNWYGPIYRPRCVIIPGAVS